MGHWVGVPYSSLTSVIVLGDTKDNWPTKTQSTIQQMFSTGKSSHETEVVSSSSSIVICDQQV